MQYNLGNYNECPNTNAKLFIICSASQMWMLGYMLPIMLGDVMEEGSSTWESYLLLLEIVDYLLSPVITTDDCMYLKVKIQIIIIMNNYFI